MKIKIKLSLKMIAIAAAGSIAAISKDGIGGFAPRFDKGSLAVLSGLTDNIIVYYTYE
ncbi:MAG: hypothetical protein LBB72_00750 [Spirochaetaceae bacterium]|jgi:hypothetical protein|nr:hypothetical protein [Spirochaetaceae bacterium]